MIVFFSMTCHTKAAAHRLHVLLGEDLVELKVVEGYTEADLNWQIEDSRANLEQRNQAPLPTLANPVDVSQAEVLYLGFPLWWGIPPKIIDVFLRSHDLGQVPVLPFCTSGSSPMGEADAYLAKTYPQVNWKKGLRFHQGLTDEEIRAWAAQ